MLKLAEEGVIYARVSSARQIREGRGLQSQVSACKRYAKEKGFKHSAEELNKNKK